ncbi:hypothetical protein ACFQT0_24770 [Hymenobacter humi]|uniref:Uncharacterized protein n=1 Tax=Hymenobacter humi TaxID=1411620 RepID=A0ABW2U9M3_9BACT
MIIYKSTDWWEALRHLRSSGIIRLLLKRVLWVGLYATAVTAVVVQSKVFNFTVDKEFSLSWALCSACCWCFGPTRPTTVFMKAAASGGSS